MKKILLLTKTLLAAVLLCVGQNAWAAEVTETYDFYSWAEAGDAVITAGATKITNASSIEETIGTSIGSHALNNRFAFSAISSGSSFGWRLRKDARSGYGYQYGLYTQGKAPDWGPFYWSICNLKVGDQVTIVWEKRAGKNADPKFVSINAKNGEASVAAGDVMASGTTYTITEEGHLDLVQNDNNCAIKSVTIVTTGTETIEADPKINVTGANLGNRIITIVDSKTNSGNSTKTYYTKDGTTPTNLSTLYDGPFTVTSADVIDGNVTIKAITYKEGDTSVASEVTTKVLTDVGTTLTLNAPVITFAGFVLEDGKYRPQYNFSSDQASVIGNPVPTISYSFAGGAATEATSYTSTAVGSLTVTVSKDGYNSNSTVLNIVGGNFSKTYSFDAINDVELAEPVDWASGGSATSVNGAGWSFATLNYTTYTLRADLSLKNIVYARATTANTKQGFYARTSGASIGYTLADGEIIVFNTLGNPIIATSASSSTAIAQYTNIRKIEVYTPSSVSVTVSDAGYATYVNSDYDLNFSATDIKAYKAKANTETGVVTLTEVANVPAGTPVVLVKDGGATENIPVMTGAAAVSENDLVAGTGDPVATDNGDGKYNYVLDDVSGIGFYKANGVTVATNRAYLQTTYNVGSNGARSMRMVFDGITGVANVEAVAEAKAQDGKFIENGKIVIVKNGKKFNAAGALIY